MLSDLLFFLGLKRPEKEIRLEPLDEVEVETKPDRPATGLYRIENIRQGAAHKFVGEVFYANERQRIGLAMGNSEAALVKHAQGIMDAHQAVSQYKNKSIPL